MPTVDMSQLSAALVAAGITGPHKSHDRRNMLGAIEKLVGGEEGSSFGLTGMEDRFVEEVLGFVAELTGCSADPSEREGRDTMDPERTVNGIVAAADRLATEARKGSLLLAATGHPTGMLEHHIRVVDAYRRAGGKVLKLREGERFHLGNRSYEVRYTAGVGCLSNWGSLLHTHSSHAMEFLLAGEPWPDIVLGDHGFAGAALERGIPAIAVMDINDPALAVAWAQGKDVTIVPMDDNRRPDLYEPSWRAFESILDDAV